MTKKMAEQPKSLVGPHRKTEENKMIIGLIVLGPPALAFFIAVQVILVENTFLKTEV